MALSGPPRCAYDAATSLFREPPDERRSPQYVAAQIPQGRGRDLAAGNRKAIRAADAAGKLKGKKSVTAQMVLIIGEAGLNHKVDGVIELE
jgi:hypothetical protein